LQLVAIGPLSNVAAALRLDPDFSNRLLGLTIMGGVRDERGLPEAWQRALKKAGRTAAWPDHNTASDPTAALACARSGVAITWITTEVTLGVPLRRDARERLPRTAPLGLALGRMLDVWNDEWFQATLPKVDGPPPVPVDAVALLHDPLTVAANFPGDWLTLANARLSYGLQNGLFRLRDSGGNDGVAARVSVRADGAGFEAFCVERIVQYIGRLQGSLVRT
jgi:purine nucleosidase